MVHIKYVISRQILAKLLPDQHHRVHLKIHRQPLSWLLNIFKVKKTIRYYLTVKHQFRIEMLDSPEQLEGCCLFKLIFIGIGVGLWKFVTWAVTSFSNKHHFLAAFSWNMAQSFSFYDSFSIPGLSLLQQSKYFYAPTQRDLRTSNVCMHIHMAFVNLAQYMPGFAAFSTEKKCWEHSPGIVWFLFLGVCGSESMRMFFL